MRKSTQTYVYSVVLVIGGYAFYKYKVLPRQQRMLKTPITNEEMLVDQAPQKLPYSLQQNKTNKVSKFKNTFEKPKKVDLKAIEDLKHAFQKQVEKKSYLPTEKSFDPEAEFRSNNSAKNSLGHNMGNIPAPGLQSLQNKVTKMTKLPVRVPAVDQSAMMAYKNLKRLQLINTPMPVSSLPRSVPPLIYRR